jgi:hypothetical protein
MNIELTQEQVAAFNRGESITITPKPKPKPKQWEPRGGSHRSTIKVGRNSALALVEAEEMLYFYDKLLKYVDEFGGDWEADWSDTYQNKYAVCYNSVSNTWDCISAQYAGSIGTVYMSRECVDGLTAKLKSGEVVL